MNTRTIVMSFALLFAGALAACGGSDSSPDSAIDTAIDTASDAVPDADAAPDAVEDGQGDVAIEADAAGRTLTIRYHRPDASYAGWTLTTSGDVVASGLAARRVDHFGAVCRVPPSPPRGPTGPPFQADPGRCPGGRVQVPHRRFRGGALRAQGHPRRRPATG